MPFNHKGIGEYAVKVCTYEILFQMRIATHTALFVYFGDNTEIYMH